MALPIIRSKSSSAVMASWSNLCIVWIHAQLTVADVQQARKMYETIASENKDGFVSAIVVASNVGLPTDDARKAVSDMMRGLENSVLAMVGIMEATGFKAATIRSIMAAMSLLSRVSYIRKITASVGEASPLIAPHIIPAASPEAVEAAIAYVKKASAIG